jgi:hypothetical protein
MKKISTILSFVFCLLSFGNSFAAPSPVVQVISYKEPLGMYFSLQGWGSGSIIDSSGHILTNNHVVDDGFGGISDDFSICLTEDSSLPPKCHYTASVVARDAEKDIALLQIDRVDIFGNAVNYSSFATLPIDYSYSPNTGDTVIARGYPWVGANTITETQGIVSGTYMYNNNTYIKTDTLIAGGNSGGPLIRDGKMIGVNTFLIGGSADPALGYSLSIREAQDFIQTGVAQTTKLQTNSTKFAPFLQSINSFVQRKQVTDSLVTFNFPEKYTITTYIPGSYIDGQIAEESTTDVYGFSFLHFTIPKLTTPEEIRYFLASQSFFPFSQDVKFRTVTIGWQSFYEVDMLGNTGGDKAKTQYVYFKIVNGTHLLLLQLSTPLSNETTYDLIQENIDRFLAGVLFPTQFTFTPSGSIEVADAHVIVRPTSESLVDFRSNFFPYNGVISQLMVTYDDLFSVRTYLWNLWSYAQVSIVPNSFYTENTSATELLQKLKEVPYFSDNTESNLVTYKWHEGFIVCESGTGWLIADEKNRTHATVFCEVIFFVGWDDSHFLSLMFLTEKRKKAEIYTLMQEYLDTYISVSGTGTTNFGTLPQKLTYTDVQDQSQEFQDDLKNLIKYGILSPRPLFDGEHPFTWDEYVRLHIWAIYHKRLTDTIIPGDPKSPTFESIIKKMPIDWRAYVNSTQRDSFELMLRIQLAGVKLPEYTERMLDQFITQRDTKYHAEWQAIEDFEYLYFMGQKMSPNGASYYNSGYYTPDFYVIYNPLVGLSYEPVFSADLIQFGTYEQTQKARKILESQLECTRTSATYFSAACFKKREEYIWSLLSYDVLTKWQAISRILPSIDFALWDSELLKKKTVKIEQED